MFLEHYRLEHNPFVPGAVRPWLASHSAHQAVRELDELLRGRLYCLFLSGPTGVGKSTLVGQRLREAERDISWIKPGIQSRELFLAQLISDLGLGVIEGTITELRRIAEVFLRHQAGNGQVPIIVVDGLERLSLPVLRELEGIAQLRLKHRPVVHLVLLVRNEDLVASLSPQLDGGRFARIMHQRLSGFTLDETQTYLRACLQGASCAWPDELFPPEAVIDVQAFTQGVVGDVDALCCEVLERLAACPPRVDGAPPRVTRTLLKEAAAALHLRYDPSPWQSMEAELSPEAVRLTDPSELQIEVARLLVSSGGRQIAEIVLDRPRMVLGRDRTCDISLDSRYVSRYQNLFMDTGEGWVLIDLNSTNGCFVNGRRVREHKLHDGDLIAVGQHQLRFTCAGGAAVLPARPSAALDETLVGPAPVLGTASIPCAK